MKKTCFLIVSLSVLCNSFAQTNEKKIAEISAIENGLIKNIQVKGEPVLMFNIQERMNHYKVPGVSIAVIENGNIKWARGYGFANTQTKAKIDVNTLFQAGSISKPVAALAALKLYENKQVDLKKDVRFYLKNWQLAENKYTRTEKVTLEKLLSHTAGITVHGFPGYQQGEKIPELTDVLNGKGNTEKIEIDTIPGSIWRYSGGGYTIMEKIVEDVSGLALDEYMARTILQPLGMNNSSYLQPISQKWQKNCSAAYDGNGSMIKGMWNNYPEQAAAGLWTTPSDLARYCIEIQNIVQGKKKGILSKKTVDQMLTKYKNDWGLGPALMGEKNDLIFGHSGKNAGFTNDLKAQAYQGNGIIIMTNADNGAALITEIQNAICNHYNWSFSQPTTIALMKLKTADLEQYVGTYKLKEQLSLKIILKNNQLVLTDTPIGNLSLSPITKTKFIALESGTTIDFLVDQQVTGFLVDNSIHFVKTK
jgi:CubicO group peptidase (beta-lactamase class C family)